ncbi:MAG: hypothetical protein U0Q22_14405 [Acidimicrobiales bacterium]
MLRLSDLVGAPVRSSDDLLVGRLVDATVRLGSAGHIDRVLIGRRSSPSLVVPRHLIGSIETSELEVSAPHDEVAGRRFDDTLAEDELRLVRDVLDTQIVDVDGRRIVRVGDVILERPAEGGLQAAAVDVGIGSVCHRLGLRSLAARLDEQAVPWDALHLTSARGHAVQLATPKANLHRLGPEELAVVLAAISTSSGRDVLAAVEPDLAEAALGVAPSSLAERLRRDRDHDVPVRRYRRHRGWRRRLPVRTGNGTGRDS